MSPALNGHHNVANMIPAMTKIAERVCSKLDEQDGGTVEFVETFERYTHDVVALAGLGFDATAFVPPKTDLAYRVTQYARLFLLS
eukprot:g7362.t1